MVGHAGKKAWRCLQAVRGNMSHILLKNTDLFFRVRRERSIKSLLTLHTDGFHEFGADGSVHVIKKMNLELHDGDRLAIIGHNGAGKSTLLKLIAGIYPPSGGVVETSGRISCLFELATGFQMECSGWENIYLRGLMLGETPQSMKSKMQAIAEFSELGDFLEMPVKYYSSGMFMRLAFSVSTAIQPDILLLDEVMGAGDAGFLAKAQKRMRELMDVTKILVFVTHSMHSAEAFCNRCLWLDKGIVLEEGTPKDVCSHYLAKMTPR